MACQTIPSQNIPSEQHVTEVLNKLLVNTEATKKDCKLLVNTHATKKLSAAKRIGFAIDHMMDKYNRAENPVDTFHFEDPSTDATDANLVFAYKSQDNAEAKRAADLTVANAIIETAHLFDRNRTYTTGTIHNLKKDFKSITNELAPGWTLTPIDVNGAHHFKLAKACDAEPATIAVLPDAEELQRKMKELDEELQRKTKELEQKEQDVKKQEDDLAEWAESLKKKQEDDLAEWAESLEKKQEDDLAEWAESLEKKQEDDLAEWAESRKKKQEELTQKEASLKKKQEELTQKEASLDEEQGHLLQNEVDNAEWEDELKKKQMEVDAKDKELKEKQMEVDAKDTELATLHKELATLHAEKDGSKFEQEDVKDLDLPHAEKNEMEKDLRAENDKLQGELQEKVIELEDAHSMSASSAAFILKMKKEQEENTGLMADHLQKFNTKMQMGRRGTKRKKPDSGSSGSGSGSDDSDSD
jgi:hypothetical protein